MTSEIPGEDALFEDLSRRLRDAHRAVAALDVPPDAKGAIVRRLIAITDASKHDLRRASERLDLLMAEIDPASDQRGRQVEG